MKIALFDFNMNFGGASQGSLFLLHRLKGNGFKVEVIDAYGKNERYRNKAKEYDLKFTVLYPNASRIFVGKRGFKRAFAFVLQTTDFYRLLYALASHIKKSRPKVVIVNNNKSLFFLSVVKFFLNFKILLYYRGEALSSQMSPGFRRRINKKVDAVVTHSHMAYTNLRAFITCHEKLHFAPNCVDLSALGAVLKNSDLPLIGDGFSLLLAAGRPERTKGHDIAVKAVSELKAQGLIVQLIIPGTVAIGHTEDYYIYLQNLIVELGIEDQVYFIGWRDNFLGDVIQCDAVVLPSHTEGFPRSIIEAMYLGVPVCATPVGGIPEAIRHGETGLLFEVDNVGQLSNAIRSLVINCALRNNIITNAKIFSAEYFDPKRNTQVLTNVLAKLDE